jgi:predicted amidophosphoribosyltransferase
MDSTPTFTWPPRPDAPIVEMAPVDRDVRSKLGTPPRKRAPVWRSVERAWLAPVREPLRTRIADLGWAPDAPDAYCDRCGRTLGPHEDHEFGCAGCAHRRFPWTRLVRLGAFHADLREWVLEAKFEASHAMALSLGRELGVRLRDAGVMVGGVGGERIAVAPVPVDPVRRFLRGIDHTAWLARGVARELGVPVRRVLRAKRGPSQRSVAPSAREANVRGRFVARGRVGSASRLILVDDVVTTGATMRAAVRALAAPGRDIWVGVVGVTPEPGRIPVRAGGEGVGVAAG